MFPETDKCFRIVHRDTCAAVTTSGMEIAEALAVLGVTEEEIYWVSKRSKLIGRVVRRERGKWPVPIRWDKLGPDQTLRLIGFEGE